MKVLLSRPPRQGSWHRLASLIFAGMAIMPSALHAEPARPAVTVVAFGDSLTAGYLLQPSESFAAQLQMALEAKGHKVVVVNAGVSGDTTAGGLDRLAWTLEPGADAVILELGANDALRGSDPVKARDNLDRMLNMITANGIPVLIAGMKAPGNWGPDYAKAFDSIFPDLAAKYKSPLYPFFLEGVALNPAFVMADGLHPTAKGVAEIVKRILPEAEALVARAQTKKSAAKN